MGNAPLLTSTAHFPSFNKRATFDVVRPLSYGLVSATSLAHAVVSVDVGVSA